MQTLFRRFASRYLLTLSLVTVESAGWIFFPLFIGRAIDSVLAGSARGLYELGALGLFAMGIAVLRRLVDSREGDLGAAGGGGGGGGGRGSGGFRVGVQSLGRPAGTPCPPAIAQSSRRLWAESRSTATPGSRRTAGTVPGRSAPDTASARPGNPRLGCLADRLGVPRIVGRRLLPSAT